MTEDHISVWENCIEYIRKKINPQSFKTWFEPIKPIRLSNNSLTILVPNKFFYEWIEENYVSLLKTCLRNELGKNGRLEYQIVVENHKKPSLPKYNNYHESTRSSDKNEEIRNPFVIPGIKKIKVNPQLNFNYTLDNFIEGDCNKLLRSAGYAISREPGKTAFNPLVVYGDVGLGKTHLIHAIGNEILKNDPSQKVLYVSLERFTNQIIQAIKNNSVNDFINFYQMIDVLIVDDIQYLKGRAKTQEIFFNIFNQLHQNGKQIILSSDRSPKDLEGIENRLISRFKWGLTADLQAPDFETRIAILESKMEKDGIKLSRDIVEFICYNIKNNIRELEGVLISLIAQSSLNQREINLDLTKEVITKFINQINKEISVESIKNLVADHFNLPVARLQEKTRKRSVVVARQLSMYLAKDLTDKSLKHIGSNFGGRDHTTVIYSCKAVKDLMDTDLLFKDTVTELKRKVQMSLVGR